MHRSLSLPQELSIYSVAALQTRLSALLAEGGRTMPEEGLEVDASAVEEVDAAGVQWLLGLSATLVERGSGLVLANPGPALVGACAALGVSGLLAKTPRIGSST